MLSVDSHAPTRGLQLSKTTIGSFRVNSTNGSQVSVSNIAQQIPKITLVSIMKACQILDCNSEYFWRYSLSNVLFCIVFLPSRLNVLPLKYHINFFYTDRGMNLAIYIYNSVLTRRHRHINSSASTPPNATKIAEMKVSHHGLEIVGPELLFSIYKCCFLEFVCAR